MASAAEPSTALSVKTMEPHPGRLGLDAVNTIEEVAAFAKVSPRTVMRAIAAGKLKALRAGAQLRITDRSVWAWLEAGQRE